MHPYVPELAEQYRQGKVDRREFLRYATLLGVSVAGAKAFLAHAAPAVAQTPVASEITRGGELLVQFALEGGSSVVFDDPHRLGNIPSSNVVRQVAEYLTYSGPDNVAEPFLLESWEPAADLRTWTLRVREGVTFNTGRALDADDVVWNITRWLDEETVSTMRDLMSYMTPEGVEKVDDMTVRLHLDRPSITVPYDLFHYQAVILPREFGGDWTKEPWGTGAFDFVEHIPGERIVFRRREGYWRTGADGQPLPYLDSIRFGSYGQEVVSIVGSLSAGQVHWASIQFAGIASFADVPNTEIIPAQSSAGDLFRMRADQEPWSDERVRTALKLTMDRQKMLDIAYGGYGDLTGDYHVAPVQPDYAPMDIPQQDLARARELLAEAGHPNGIDVSLRLPTGDDWRASVAQIMQQDAAQAGFNISLEIAPPGTFYDTWMETNFQLTNWGHRPLPLMNLGLGYRCGAVWNESHWCDPEFDALLDEASGIIDVEERRQVMAQIQAHQQEHGTIAIPFWQNHFYAINTRLQNLLPHPSGYLIFTESWLS